MDARMPPGTDEDDPCGVPRAEHERADVIFLADGDAESDRDEEDGYGFGV